MVKFLHSSDWQMGLRAIHAGSKAREVRARRFDAASRLVDLAKTRNVEFVLLAGDVFEHHDVDEVVVKRTVDILNRFAPIPVYVLPGNHDPYVPGGVWDRQSWKRVESHVTLLTERAEKQISGTVSLYPCPLFQKRSTLDPTAWIPQRSLQDRRLRIGLAHGSLDILADTANFPIYGKRAELSGLDYLALGDWHGFLQHGKAVYSGTMEPTSFSEHEAGHAVVVEIANPGGVPKVEQVTTRSLTWAEFKLDIDDVTDVETLDKSIKALGPLDSLVLRIAPTLHIGADETTLQRLETLQAELTDGLFLLEWKADPSAMAPSDSGLRLPEGVLQRVDEAMSGIVDGRIPEGPGQAFADRDRAQVQEARALLHRLARERTT